VITPGDQRLKPRARAALPALRTTRTSAAR